MTNGQQVGSGLGSIIRTIHFPLLDRPQSHLPVWSWGFDEINLSDNQFRIVHRIMCSSDHLFYYRSMVLCLSDNLGSPMLRDERLLTLKCVAGTSNSTITLLSALALVLALALSLADEVAMAPIHWQKWHQ